MVGGIATTNTKTIFNCINYGNITINSDNMNIFAGGITAYTANNNSVDYSIYKCGIDCEFNITKQQTTTYVICGGISGYMSGNIKNCFSLAQFNNAFEKETNNLFSLVVSYTSGTYSTLNIYFENIYCLASSNTTKTLILVEIPYIFGYQNNYIENYDFEDNITIYESKTEIEESEVYWHE